MDWKLRDDLAFCRVGGCLIFLDIRNDRYFRLPDRLERTFSDYIGSRENERLDVGELVRRGILVRPEDSRSAPLKTAVEPTRSALEDVGAVAGTTIGTIVEVLAIVLVTKRRLHRRRLKSNLDGLAAYRARCPSRSPATEGDASMRSMFRAAATFMRARRCIPIDTTCLLDSLCLVRFLARRGLRADIVFGVTAHPFAAHCWVQSGDAVLNDTLGSAGAHTPIWTF